MTIWTDLAGVAFRQAYINAGGIRTRIIDAGSGEPVVFLHGTGGHAEAFARNVAAHARHFRVIVVDMIGHGYSDGPDIDYSMQTLIDHLRDVLDALGLARVNLGGVSLGGLVSMWFAIQHPERVARVISITAMLMQRDGTGKDELRDANARTRAAASTLTREAVRQRLAWLMARPEVSVTEELVDVRLAIYAQPGRGPITARISQIIVGGIIDDDWARQWSSVEHLPKIRCPVLVIWTRHNPGMTAERAALGARHIARHRFVVLDDSGHWPQWEEAERFNQESIAFLQTPLACGA